METEKTWIYLAVAVIDLGRIKRGILGMCRPNDGSVLVEQHQVDITRNNKLGFRCVFDRVFSICYPYYFFSYKFPYHIPMYQLFDEPQQPLAFDSRVIARIPRKSCDMSKKKEKGE